MYYFYHSKHNSFGYNPALLSKEGFTDILICSTSRKLLTTEEITMLNERHSFSVASTADFMYRVYAWMAFGLGISAVVAFMVASNPAAVKALLLSPLRWVVFLGQIGLVVALAGWTQKFSYATCVALFSFYAALSGVTLSTILLLYTLNSVYLGLAITAGTFATMAIYGYVTKTDLTSLGSFLTMGLFGISIAMLANIWFQSPATQYYISLIAVGIFTLLTAYDVQKIKEIGQQTMMTENEGRQKVAIVCALELYLDFVNLFIHLMRLFGKRRD